MPKTTNRNDFAYSVALVRTLETMLLNNNEVERMVLAESAQDAFKILNEFDYADNKSGIDNVSDFQKVLNEGLVDIHKILEKVTPDKNILNIIWLPYDFHNIKTMLKAKLSEKSFEEIENLLSPLGAIPIHALKMFIFEENNASFCLENEHIEQYIKKKIKKTPELFEKEDKNPQVIDLYLDQKLVKIIHGIALDSKSKFLLDYVKIYIDLMNIKIFFRMKTQKKDIDLFKIAFLWHGTIDFKKFKEAYNEEVEKSPEIFGSKYFKIINEGLKHYQAEKTFLFLEKEIENYLIDFIKKAKLMPFGPEPLIAYYLAKRNNALILRMILISKLNNVESDEIKKRLRNLYS